MNPDPQHYYLLAAFLATWAIHGAYLVILAQKYKKIRREMETLRKSGWWVVVREAKPVPLSTHQRPLTTSHCS